MNRLTSFVCLSLTLASCSPGEDATGDTAGAAVEPISHARAALMVTTNTETALTGLTNAGGFLAESTTLASTLDEMGAGSESCTVTVCSTPDCVGSTETCETDEVTTEDLAEAQQEIKDAIAELVDELETRFFNEANIESSEEKSVTYLLGPDDLCNEALEADVSDTGELPVPGAEPAPAALDPECVDEVTRAQVRLRVTSPSEGNVDVTVMLTAERYEPLVFELHQDRLAVTTNLDQMASSIEALGEDLQGLESLEGRVQFELVKNAPQDYSARVNVLNDVKVVVVEETDRVEFSLGAASPTTELRLDGNAKTISATYNYGPIRVAGPLSTFASMFEDDVATVTSDDGSGVVQEEPEPKTYAGNVEAVLAGLDGVFSFNGQTDEFTFTGIGFGDATSTFKHDGNTVLALDVNAEQGRHFDVTVKDTTSGLEFTFSPTLDVSVLFAFRHLADQIDVPNVLLDDQLRLFFDGTNPSVRAMENGLEVTSGTLHLTSSADPTYDLEVAAGMCLLGTVEEEPATTDSLPAEDPLVAPAAVPVEQEEESSDEHPFSGLSVGACE
jgi:hypothetical protein